MQDREILDAFKEPKKRELAFRELVEAYQERVYWHVRKMVIVHDDANDVTQDVFIKVYKNLGGFRESSQLFTWIYRIATNEAISYIKKKQRKQAQSLDDVHHELENYLSSGHHFSGDEIQLRLQQSLLKLPEKQRLVFNMKYFDDLKYDQIAEITGTSVGALKASYHLAVKKLEQDLKED